MNEEGHKYAEAVLKVKVGDDIEHTAADGNGPVNALDKALRKALVRFYPEIKNVHLVDYKVRVLNERNGTAAKVRVLVESGDEEKTWSTVGVSHDIIEASLQALNDSLNYEILKMQKPAVQQSRISYQHQISNIQHLISNNPQNPPFLKGK